MIKPQRIRRRLAERLHQQADRGFSLIELIIVIVILGILVAIAIPIYNNIQGSAKTNAVKTAAANGASQAVSDIANGTKADGKTAGTIAVGDQLTNLESGSVTYVAVAKNPTDTSSVCVIASATLPTTTTTPPTTQPSGDSGSGATTWFSGPGAASDGMSCK